MLSNTKKKVQSSELIKKEDKKSEPTYWERVIHGKGTVAEDWPTAEELWNNPDIKEEMKEVQSILKSPKKE